MKPPTVPIMGNNLKAAKAKVPKMGINCVKVVGATILIITAIRPTEKYRTSVRMEGGICCHILMVVRCELT